MTIATKPSANPILAIEALGQSIWMDNLARDLIESGELAQLIETKGLLGITSNPAIFEKAIVGNKVYDSAIDAGIKAKKSLMEIYESLVFEDICNACDIFRGVYDQSNALDGYISIEVPPTLAANTSDTITEAKRYNKVLAKPNVMIKIPGTPEGLVAVTEVIAAGINVNVTLLFSLQSYIDTAWAYIAGLEKLAATGADISKVASVASFFLSRIDANIDAQLDKKLAVAGISNATKTKLEGIKGKVAIANAKMAYKAYKEICESDRWKALEAKGAKVQRLLWASTSTKNPAYSDVMYVDELVGADTVNTLPPQTIDACVDHCDVGDRIETNVDEAIALIASLKDSDVNIDLDATMADLLEDGIVKFVQPFDALMKSLQGKIDAIAAA
ncbi:MAG: transaldolase [Alkalinema sp. CAN_BIN05]|nr:transaldolase [Alkalinema sp. CAN_BIN05]